MKVTEPDTLLRIAEEEKGCGVDSCVEHFLVSCAHRAGVVDIKTF